MCHRCRPGTGRYVFENLSSAECSRLTFGNNLGANLPISRSSIPITMALPMRLHRCMQLLRACSVHVLELAANESFVNFDRPAAVPILMTMTRVCIARRIRWSMNHAVF